MKKILIIDDDRDMRTGVTDLLKEEGYNVFSAVNGREGIAFAGENHCDLVLLDKNMPDMDGMQVLEEIKKIDNKLPIIILTGFSDIKTAVQAMKLGAFDYLTKPFENEEICLVVKKAIQVGGLSREIEILQQRLEEKKEFPTLIGKSRAMEEVIGMVRKVAPTDMTVFLQGESGTGKEMFARTIHYNSLRSDKPFIAVDCGTLPETLIESELFGYEKGAFTGADKSKMGQFELAEEGTIFLDEITNITALTQAKLLRVIQEKEIQHLGGKRKTPINVRIIAASNLPLEKAVKDGLLREDLYHRLNEFNLQLPPLRKRSGDVAILAEYFLREANMELKKQVKKIMPEAMVILEKYFWPGNVRELRNMIRRSVLLADDIILPKHLQVSMRTTTPLERVDLDQTGKKQVKLKKAKNRAIESAEKKAIQDELIKTGYHRGKTAKNLGIGSRTLFNKMMKYGL